MSDRKVGAVLWFDNAKGWGFILNEDNVQVFVHYRAIQDEGFKTLSEHDAVSFLQVTSEKGLQAQEVKKL